MTTLVTGASGFPYPVSFFDPGAQGHDKQQCVKRQDSRSRPVHDVRHSASAEAAVLARRGGNDDGIDLAKM